MGSFPDLLRQNRNYRLTWLGQIVSEIGDHFNTISVFSLALSNTGSGLIVAAIMLSRAIPMILAGPIAGVMLDRWDRKKIMLASDLFRGVIAMLFLFAIEPGRTWLLYLLSGLLMFASPFFTSGRTAILPTIASREELHTANSLTQSTGYMAVTIGTLFGGLSAGTLGYQWAFLINAASFLFSALMVSLLHLEQGHFRPPPKALNETDVMRPWHEYREGLRYMKATPLILGIALTHVGWATGGGAAQILFSLFGEVIFDFGPLGIGMIWSSAGVGLLVGAAVAHVLAPRVSFGGYKRTIVICYLLHGVTYVAFSQAAVFWQALLFVGMSRAAVAVCVVMNQGHLLRHVENGFRGRVFATIETMTWATMMVSLSVAGAASEFASPRTIAAVAGVCSGMTGVFWGLANWKRLLPEPPLKGIDPLELEVRREHRI